MELPDLTPEYFEILAVRELRKAGLEPDGLRRHRRSRPPEPEHGYGLEFTTWLVRGDRRHHVLLAVRRQQQPIDRPDVEVVAEHAREAGAAGVVLFADVDITADGLDAAAALGVALLRVRDGRAAFDTGGWGTAGHYPAWLPAHLAQLVERDPAGAVRYRSLDRAGGDAILGRVAAPGDTPNQSKGGAG